MVPIGVFPPRFLGFPRYSNALAMFQAGRPCSMLVLKGMLLGAKKTARGEALAMLMKMIFWHAYDVDFTMKLLQRWKPWMASLILQYVASSYVFCRVWQIGNSNNADLLVIHAELV